ncbi:MAG: exodeoxyribonuclease VII large subunit, partial [Marinicella sp.]
MISTRGKTAQNPLTPSVLNQMLKKHLSEQFGSFWLTGEIFEYYQSPAGHSYFTLKDNDAGIKCVLFKQKQSIPLKKGIQITLLGQMSLYTPKGDIQVNVLKVIESGQGDLAQQFIILKQKLMNAGLFDASKKQAIPKIIHSLGIITSSKGAALQDVLNVFLRNNPLINVTVYHTPVQGNDAAPQINHALRTADENNHDVLLLTRGGGSKEDLWVFNDEFLAHQLAQLKTPVISAIGHETDESISDLVADISCITPTAAAQLISGNFAELNQNLTHASKLLDLLIQDKLRVFQQKIDSSLHQLEKKHPENLLKQQIEALNHSKHNLDQVFDAKKLLLINKFQQTQQQLEKNKPGTALQQQTLNQLNHSLTWQLKQVMEQAKQKLSLEINDLNHQNPLNVLSRGYSITTDLT